MDKADPGGLRADAERNRATIVAAAQEVFAEAGTDASPSRIARRAGVGVSTLYRRFPTREVLVEAVFGDQHAQCRVHLAEIEESEAPWPALRAALRQLCAQQVTDKGFTAELLAACFAEPRHTESRVSTDRRQLGIDKGQLTELITRAHQPGGLRADVGPTEIYLLVAGNAGVITAAGPTAAAAASRRYVDLMLQSFDDAAPSGATRRSS